MLDRNPRRAIGWPLPGRQQGPLDKRPARIVSLEKRPSGEDDVLVVDPIAERGVTGLVDGVAGDRRVEVPPDREESVQRPSVIGRRPPPGPAAGRPAQRGCPRPRKRASGRLRTVGGSILPGGLIHRS